MCPYAQNVQMALFPIFNDLLFTCNDPDLHIETYLGGLRYILQVYFISIEAHLEVLQCMHKLNLESSMLTDVVKKY